MKVRIHKQTYLSAGDAHLSALCFFPLLAAVILVT